MDNKAEATALAPVEERPRYALLRPVVSPAELIECQKEVHTLIASALENERDYGVIPGTKKPTLLKPGAERINLAFGVYPRYTVAEREVNHEIEIPWKKRSWKWGEKRGEKIWSEESGVSLGLYRYVVRCELVKRTDGEVVGEGIGSASTLESKYIDRPRDLENTVLKMAQKRAFVAATLNAYALSDRFTQDMEDIPSDGDGAAEGREEKRPPHSEAKPEPKPQPRKTESGNGKQPAWRSNDHYRFGKHKGRPLSEGGDADLHDYFEAISKGLQQGKGYATQEHLDEIAAEIAHRESGEEHHASDGEAPPHTDDDIPF